MPGRTQVSALTTPRTRRVTSRSTRTVSSLSRPAVRFGSMSTTIAMLMNHPFRARAQLVSLVKYTQMLTVTTTTHTLREVPALQQPVHLHRHLLLVPVPALRRPLSPYVIGPSSLHLADSNIFCVCRHLGYPIRLHYRGRWTRWYYHCGPHLAGGKEG